MDTPIAWLLNLDADEELERGPHYRLPDGAQSARLSRFAARLGALVAGEHVLSPSPAPGDARGCAGRAFCPTPSALARLEAAGATPPRAPEREILRAVNHRAFSAELGQTLAGATYAWSAEALDRALATARGTWVLKRPFGFAGRGQRRLRSGEASSADRAWIAAALARGEGLQVEPWVDRLLDVAQHGYVHPDRTRVLGTPTVQVCSATGAWIESRVARAGELRPGEHAALAEELRRAGEALALAGYFGPYGVDGFRFRGDDGVERFQPRSEINARYSMGWAIGMGTFRAAPGLP